MKRITCCAWLVAMGGLLMAAPKPVTKVGDDLLAPGRYTGTIKAFVCGGCAEWVQSKLSAVKALDQVTADQKTREVQFTVKKEAKVKQGDIQKVLDAAAKEMGMGADFTLTELKKPLK